MLLSLTLPSLFWHLVPSISTPLNAIRLLAYPCLCLLVSNVDKLCLLRRAIEQVDGYDVRIILFFQSSLLFLKCPPTSRWQRPEETLRHLIPA